MRIQNLEQRDLGVHDKLELTFMSKYENCTCFKVGEGGLLLGTRLSTKT